MRRLRLTGRFLVIAAMVTFFGFLYVVGRFFTLFVFDAERRRVSVARLRGRVLRASLARLGATFVKLGQVMSTRPDLFDRELIDELRGLQDRLPAFSMDGAKAIVEADLGGSLDAHFASFEAPIAAASVAQVHRARLHDGSEVAVKILRPDVHEQVERDAAILLAMARVLEWIPRARASEPREHLSHFVQGIIDQTDLRLEAEHYERFRRNFAGVEGVRFPRVYGEHSGRRVLTMEFLHGTKVDELGPGDHSLVVDRLRNALLKMLFEDGFVHADLHPGNFVITKDQEIAIFDVGLVKGLSDASLIQFIDWNKCLVMGTSEDYVHHLRTYFLSDRDDVDWAALTADVDAFAKTFRGKSAAEIESKEIIQRALSVGRKYGLRPMTEMTLIMVAMITCEGVGKQLDPTSDSMAKVAAYLMPILARRGMMPAAAQVG